MDRSTFYFQIGFNKCGTTSIAAFFNRSGIPCVHFDRGRLGRQMQSNLLDNLPLLTGYDDRYRAFTDMGYFASDDYFEGFKRHLEMMDAYADSKFILNTRNRENWIRSMFNYYADRGSNVAVFQYWQYRYGTTDRDALADCWRQEWDVHHENVIAEVPGDRLLVFDIEQDDPALLCQFAGLPLEYARYYTQENAALNEVGIFIARWLPLAVKRGIPQGVRDYVKQWMRRDKIQDRAS